MSAPQTGCRRTSRSADLQRAGARLTQGDLNTGEGLEQALEGAERVFHLAGVTKAWTPAEYDRCNAEGTRRLVEAMARTARPARLVYCSSLAAAGPTAVGRPLDESAECRPVTPYGKSKYGGEQAVRALSHKRD